MVLYFFTINNDEVKIDIVRFCGVQGIPYPFACFFYLFTENHDVFFLSMVYLDGYC